MEPPKDYDYWKDEFRVALGASKELSIWPSIAELYASIIEKKRFSLEQRHDIYRVLLACSVAEKERVPEIARPKSLNTVEVRTIMDR